MADSKLLLHGSDYHDKFDPRMYLQLKEQYWEADMEYHRLLHHTCEQGLFKGQRLLDLGGGPCINRLIAATTHFSEIVFSDYTAPCREEVRKWIEDREDAYDWSRHFKYVADLKGNGDDWIHIQQTLRRKITDVIHCDVLKPNPLEPIKCDAFDGIIVASCLETACPDIASFENSVKAVSSLLKPGGVVIHYGRLGGNYYCVGDARFNVITTTEDIVRDAYERAGCSIIHTNIVDCGGGDLNHLADCKDFLFMVARK